MVNAPLQRLVAVFSMLLLLPASFGQKLAPASPIDAKMRQMDARLNATVSFSADRIYLGELLEILSDKTGVALSMDNADSFSGIVIACDLEQISLADVMNSLWSLVGSKNGLWEWKADTRLTPIRYFFRPTLNARNLAARLHQALQEKFEAQAELMMRLAFLSSQTRQAQAEDIRNAMGGEETRMAQSTLEQYLAEEEVWAGMRLFASLLSADQRMRVLHGEKIDIPFSSLSRENRQSVLTLERNNSDTIYFSGDPDTISVHPHNTWVIMVGFEGDSGSDGGRFSSSGSSFAVSTNDQNPGIFADWILPGDVLTIDAETLPMKPLAASDRKGVWNSAPQTEQNLVQIAATAGGSFLAVVPAEPSDISVLPPSRTPAQYFSEIWHWKIQMHKWRSGILLAHYPTWFYGGEGRCTYALVKRLRASVQKKQGLLSLEDIVEPITTLSAAQISGITTDFPFTGGTILTIGETHVQPMTALCAFYQRYPKALSERRSLSKRVADSNANSSIPIP